MISYRHNAIMAPRHATGRRRIMPRSPGRPPSAGRSPNVSDCAVCGATYFATKPERKTCSRDCAATLISRALDEGSRIIAPLIGSDR